MNGLRAATENPRPWKMEQEARLIFHNSADDMTVLLSVLLMKSLITDEGAYKLHPAGISEAQLDCITNKGGRGTDITGLYTVRAAHFSFPQEVFWMGAIR